MKKNRNGIILIAEILIITLLHAAKIHHSEKQAQDNIVVNFPSASDEIKARIPYLIVNMLK
jgi:hypothetical protein